MFIIRGVNFDNNISNWHTPMASIPWSVLAFVIKGKVDYIINGEKIIAEPGDVLHIPEKSYRQGKNYNGKLHQKYTVIFNRKEDLPYSPSFLINDEVIQRRPANFNYMKRRVERLHMEHVENHPYQPYICNAILQELIGLLAKDQESNDIPPMNLQYVQTIKEYILKHYRQTVTIEELSQLIERSPGYTINIFKEITDQTPIQYVHYLRIREACRLLKNTNMTVTSISEHLGYYDPAYFSRMFKKYIGMSPKMFIDSDINPLYWVPFKND